MRLAINICKAEYIAIAREWIRKLQISTDTEIKKQKTLNKLALHFPFKKGTNQEEMKNRLRQTSTNIGHLKPVLWDINIRTIKIQNQIV